MIGETESSKAGGKGPLRVLLVTQWFDPEPTFKGLLFAKGLRNLGFDVRVLTGFPNYPGGKIYSGYRVRMFQRETMEGIPVLRVPLYPSHDGSGARRALNYLTFAVSAAVGVLFGKRPDVAYIYHPPATVSLPAAVLKVFRGVPYVYDVQDLWPDTLGATGMISRPSVLKIVGLTMSRIYAGAARVTVQSNGFRSTIASRGLAEERIEVIPNWADEQQIDVSAGAGGSGAGISERFTVTFAGNIGRGQALETVLDAAALMESEPRVRFLIVGGGIEADNLRSDAERRELHNVSFLPRRPIAEIGEILASADALLVHLKNDPLFEITIPSKTQAYLMAGRPILMGVRGDAAQMVEDAGAGIVFEPEDAAGLANAVRTLLGLSESRRAEMGESGRRYYRDHLSLQVGARRFAEVFEEVSLLRPRTLAIKRVFECVFAGVALVVLGVPMIAVAAAVRLRIGSPVIFRQTRPGRDGVPFELLKFRTMSERRGADGELLPDRDRITRLGSFLRASSLDELPELFNVLCGQMSLVGPRPLLMRYTEFFTKEEKLRLRVRPGITGWAQVNGRNTASWDRRLALDVWYVRHLSVWLDLKILWLTVGKVFRSHGVVIDPESTMLNLDDERRGANSR